MVTTVSGPDDGETSQQLRPGQVYTREDLKALFGVADATINTGVFRPKGTRSVWLFVTEDKTPDREQFVDRLDGDALHWQGQLAGRSDPTIIGHQRLGLELLLFYRTRKYQFPGAGFRYEGRFKYVSHAGTHPTNFILQRESSGRAIDPDEASSIPFDPIDMEDGRTRTLRSISDRRGQQAFRQALIGAYGGQCAISRCAVLDVLEAAHIVPYRGEATNRVDNGLLLRADLHVLFDCGLIAINPSTMTVLISDRLRGSEYELLDGTRIALPRSAAQRPSAVTLAAHRRESKL